MKRNQAFKKRLVELRGMRAGRDPVQREKNMPMGWVVTRP